MTSAQRDTVRYGYPNRRTPEVIAGLVNDGSADRVAREAVREAVRRGASLRFVQILRPGLGREEIEQADSATFRSAMRALRGHPRTPSSFELVQGDPTTELIARSRAAAVLVVGEDEPAGGGSVAERCRRDALCAVRTVRRSC